MEIYATTNKCQSRAIKVSKGGENTLLFVLLRSGQNSGIGDGAFLKENCQDKKRKGNQKCL